MYMAITAWLWQEIQAGWSRVCITGWVQETSVVENTAVVLLNAYVCKMNVSLSRIITETFRCLRWSRCTELCNQQIEHDFTALQFLLLVFVRADGCNQPQLCTL